MSAVARLLGKSGQVEQLEERSMLAGDPLPAGAEWTRWGHGQVAAIESQFVVTLDGAMGRANAALLARDVAQALGVRGRDFTGIGLGGAATFKTSQRITLQDAQRVSLLVPGVKWIEPDVIRQTQAVPNDTNYQQLWALNNTGQTIGGNPGTLDADIDAQEAWDITTGSRNVIIGVIDTGVNLVHPDLISNIWHNPGEVAGNGLDDDGNGYIDDATGFDFGDSDANPTDNAVHGTAVAGVIGASGNNGQGVTGVAWNVSILPLKVSSGNQDLLSTSAIVAAHDYVTMMRNRGFNIVATNNSYGTYGLANNLYFGQATGFAAERDAIQRYLDVGGIVVASAGNDGMDIDQDGNVQYPASYNLEGMITVAATDNNDGLLALNGLQSNYGVQNVDLGAPGYAITSTSEGTGYITGSGTSVSAAYVTGAVALLKTIKPSASATEIRQALINSADPTPSLQGRVRSGGRLNVRRALEIINIEGPVVRGFTPGPVTTQLSQTDNQPVRQVRIDFSKPISGVGLSTGSLALRGSGPDDIFGNANDVIIPISSVGVIAGTESSVLANLNLLSFPQQRLPIDTYQLTLTNTGFLDATGNKLNGNTSGGLDEVIDFRITGNAGENEPNDTGAQATAVTFDGTGTATFAGATIGNGLAGNLDVDLYRIDVPRGGQITAEVVAKRLTAGSTLDSYLRLFSATGEELAFNDQFFGQDAKIDYYVPTGGTYYVGVSGFGNSAYNPAISASGATQSLGNYTLVVTANLATEDVVTYTAAANSIAGQPALPLNIPRGNEPGDPPSTQGTTTAGITVQDTRQISDLNLRLNLQHTSLSDLQISLIAPSGLEVVLFNRRGGTNDDLGTRNGSGVPVTYTTFDDEASIALAAGSAPFSGSFRPDNALSGFDGLTGNGTWTLRIVDLNTGDFGRLIDWQLVFTFANNAFGPFESNETLTTASNVTEFTGSGSSTRDAFLGDGGFGSLDRDLYRIQVDPGTSLRATVTSLGAANTALRLFDSQGTQVLISSPASDNNSAIQNYVFANGGTYYLGVSESANLEYNPSVTASGVAGTTTGAYRIAINVAPGVSDPSGALEGNALQAGYSSGAILEGVLASGNRVGLRFNGHEFTDSTLGTAFFGASVDGLGFTNVGPNGDSQLPFSLNAQSDPVNNRVVASSQYNGLSIQRSFSFGDNDAFIAIDVTLTNTTGATMSGLAWMEGFNPDPGIGLGDNVRATLNDVSGKAAVARYTNSAFLDGLYAAIVAPESDARAIATIVPVGVSPRDALTLAQSLPNDPDGASSNGQVAMSFNVGDLAAGGTTSMRYFIMFSESSSALSSMITTLNTGTGGGHLTENTAVVAEDTLSGGQTVPQYPYRMYYPEGFLGPNIFTFLPMANPNSKPANVVVIQRFELNAGQPASQRDRVVDSFTIEPFRRRGVDVNTPDLFQNTLRNLPVVQSAIDAGLGGVPYALEIRSDQPIAATFSYYDLVQISSGPVAVGEAFTPETGTQWSFADVQKDSSSNTINTYLIFQVPGSLESKVTATAYDTTTGKRYTADRTVQGFGRGGFYMSAGGWDDASTQEVESLSLPDGRFGVFLDATQPIVAAKSTYDPTLRQATGTIGNTGRGATTGVITEGQFGIRNTGETLGILNTNNASTQVTFSFVFTNGSAYRTAVTVGANAHQSLDVSSLPNFTTGQAYSVFYEATLPVSISSTVPVSETTSSGTFSDAFSVTDATRAYSFWGFGEGFRPGDNSRWTVNGVANQPHPGLTESLRLYNPSTSDVVVEITLDFDLEPGVESFRRTLPAGRLTEFDIDSFITGARRANNQSYGIFVKAPTPIVAEMNHYDRLFPGAFATLGTPLGNVSAIG